MILDVLYWLFGLPCMACLQALFAVLLPAKTWEIRRLQSYVILLAGSGLSLFAFGCLGFWLMHSPWLIGPILLGYILLLVGGWLGKCVEEDNESAKQRSEESLRPSKPDSN